MDYKLLIKEILKYCKDKRAMLDRFANNGISTDVDIGRAYELNRIIDLIEREEEKND